MTPRGDQSADRRRLADELRELREATGLSAARFGEPRGWSQSKVSKIENGSTIPSTNDIEAWATAAGVSQQRIEELIALAETVGNETRRWAGTRHGTLAARTREAGQAEARAEVVRVFQPNVIPGLLQTADYARRVITLLGADESGIAAAVNARIQRQDALYNPASRFEFVLTEGALRWRPGSPTMMAVQLDRLLNVATLDTVDIRVLPLAIEAPALYVTGFTLYEIPDDARVMVETLREERFYRQDDDLDAFRAVFAACRDAALSGDDVTAFVRQLRSELPTQ